MSQQLSALNARIVKLNLSCAHLDHVDGPADVVVDAIVMDCPVPGHTHSQVIPFRDSPHGSIDTPHGPRNAWRRDSGSTVADLTLSPSFLVPSCSLHGYVRAGRWEDC